MFHNPGGHDCILGGGHTYGVILFGDSVSLFGVDLGVSKNNGTPKSSILIGFFIINHPFWGKTPYCWKHPFV